MAINLSFLRDNELAKAFFDILKLEGGQGALPDSKPLMNATLGAYAATQAGAQMFDHSVIGGILYGVVTAGVLYGSTMLIAKMTGGLGSRFVKTLTALAAVGAVAALAYIVLHLLFAIALPPPLPTAKLLRFLLFPIIFWTIIMFSWVYRHVKVGAIASFAAGILYVILTDLSLSPLLK